MNIEDISGYILGEHGDSQVPIWSAITVGGMPLDEYAKQVGVELDKRPLPNVQKRAALRLLSLKGATFYGIAMSVSNIVEKIMKG